MEYGNTKTMVFAPTHPPALPNPKAIPGVDLDLLYVPCYNGKTGRHNIHSIGKDQIAFHAANVLVLMNIETFEQTLLQGHSGDITALTYCSDQDLLISAQRKLGEEAYFVIWQASTCEKLAVVEVEESISQVATDRLGKFVSVVSGKEGAAELAIWNLVDLIKQYQSTQTTLQTKPLKRLLLGNTTVHSIIQEKDLDPVELNITIGCNSGIKVFTFHTETK